MQKESGNVEVSIYLCKACVQHFLFISVESKQRYAGLKVTDGEMITSLRGRLICNNIKSDY